MRVLLVLNILALVLERGFGLSPKARESLAKVGNNNRNRQHLLIGPLTKSIRKKASVTTSTVEILSSLSARQLDMIEASFHENNVTRHKRSIRQCKSTMGEQSAFLLL
ncbi:hypothetical protein OSTOST_23838 [Ostertagia ostertagi]